MANLGELNIDEFLSTEFNNEELRALLVEGQALHQAVPKLTLKNKELIGEVRSIKGRYNEVETKLVSKGLTIEDLDSFNPNPNNDDQIKKFQSQLENERNLSKRQIDEYKSQAEQAQAQSQQLRQTVSRSKINESYRVAAKTVGVADEFIDDYKAVLEARGVIFSVDDETGVVKGRRATDVIDVDIPSLLTNFKGDPVHQKYFAGRSAGGSGTIPGMGKNGVANPWLPEQFNVSEQTRIANLDENLALQLMELAKNV